MPTPPPWCSETQVAPPAVLSSAFSIGQSETASLPSFIASVSRFGHATEPASRWSRPMTIGALSSPTVHHRVERQAGAVALAEADPADARRQALEGDALAPPCRASGAGACRPGTAPSSWRRSCRCRPDRPRARPSGTGPCRGRTAAGCTPARSRGSRTRRPRPRRRRPGGCCCRSRRPGCRASGSRASPARASRSSSPRRRAARRGVPARPAHPAIARRVQPAGR